MSDSNARLVIDDLSGGRNGFLPPWAIKNTECVDNPNVDYYRTRLGHKRGGMAAVSMTSAGGTGIVSALIRHVPTTDQTAAELWKADDAGTPIIDRLAGGVVWATPTLKDAPTGNGWDVIGVSINGKLGLAYQSGQDRFHYWDGSTVRRAGLAAPAAPTAANTGSPSSIAFDAAGTLNYGGTLTFTHVCAGAATILWVYVRADLAVTSVTYNAVPMTLGIANLSFGNYYLFYLVNPTSGSHTIQINGPANASAGSVSYTGATTVGVPDATGSNTSASNTLATTLTTVLDNTWAVYGAADLSGTNPTAGTNCTTRSAPGAGASMTFFDSGVAITPPGPFTMTAGITVATNGSSVMASFGGGSPASASITRSYRVRWTRQSSGITKGRSEPGPALSFRPSGAGTGVQITQPTVANEGETHWEVEASTDGLTFYRIATVPIGTTTYTDTAATSSYSTNPLSALTGVYTLQKSYRYVGADQNRLLGYSSYTATDKQSRIEISAVIGSSDIGDEERIDTSAVNSIIDFDENDSGVPTGLAGPIYGTFFVFKDRQTWQLTATGNTSQPYQASAISKTIGALSHLAIARAEDDAGNAALYWMSHRGPYRWTISGLEYIGRNVEDYTLTSAMINLAATKSVARVTYFADKRQVWYWWATGSSNDCNQGMIFDVMGGGWSRIPTGDKLSNVRCAVMFSNTLGASMSLDLKPYIGFVSSANKLYKCDTGTSDDGTPYQAYILTKAYEPGGPGFYGKVEEPLLLAAAASGVTITDTVTGDFCARTNVGIADLTPTTDEPSASRVSRRLAAGGFAGNTYFYQHQIGDAAATTGGWTLDRLVVPFSKQQAGSR